MIECIECGNQMVKCENIEGIIFDIDIYICSNCGMRLEIPDVMIEPYWIRPRKDLKRI